MAKVECVRETLARPLTTDHVKEKERAGWRLVALEWEREVEGEERERVGIREEIPFRLQVPEDCRRLEENVAEIRVLRLVMEGIVQDKPFSGIASELNRPGCRTRKGDRWTQVSVFRLLPRVIEVGPRILSSPEWIARRPRLFRVA